MSVIFGSNARVCATVPIGGTQAAVASVGKWGITYDAAQKAQVVSGGSGAMLRTVGNKNWSGKYTALGHTPVAFPGDTFSFAGIISGAANAGIGASGDAMVDTVEIDIPIESGDPITHTVTFGPYSALTFGATITAALDASIPTPLPANVCKIEYCLGATAVWAATEMNEVKNVKLTLKRNNGSYVSSGTSGWQRRSQGPIDCQLDISALAKLADGWLTMPLLNTEYTVRVYVTATNYYSIKWIMFSAMGGLDVDPNSTDPVPVTFVGALTNTCLVGGTTQTLGTILKAGAPGSAWWP